MSDDIYSLAGTEVKPRRCTLEPKNLVKCIDAKATVIEVDLDGKPMRWKCRRCDIESIEENGKIYVKLPK